MATIFQADLEGTDGVALTDVNSGYDSVMADSNATAVYDTDVKIAGNSSALLTLTSNVGDRVSLSNDFPAEAVVCSRYYIRVPSFPPGNATFVNAFNGGNVVGQLQMTAAGLVRIRNVFVTVDTAATAVTSNEFFCVEWKLDGAAGQMSANLYYGANIFGDIPNEILSGPQTETQTTGLRDGLPTNPGGAWSIHLDAVIYDDAVFPGTLPSPEEHHSGSAVSIITLSSNTQSSKQGFGSGTSILSLASTTTGSKHVSGVVVSTIVLSSFTGGGGFESQIITYPNPELLFTGPIDDRSLRFYAQDILTGEWLHRDIEFSGASVKWGVRGDYTLSSGLSPVIVSELKSLTGGPLFTEWGTAIYVEEDNFIVWGGIYIGGQFIGAEYRLDSIGFAQYLSGIPYLGTFSGTKLDPAAIYRELWSHAQSYSNGDLGVVIGAQSTGASVGTEEEPYELNWWDHKDMGSEAQQLMEQTPFDIWENHRWADESKEVVFHQIDIAWPRLGRKRNDLIGKFSTDQNIIDVVAVSRDGGDFAQSIFFLGSGEGTKRKRFPLETNDGRIRRVRVIDDQSVSSQERMRKISRKAVKSLSNLVEIENLRVTDHATDLINPGDDILVQADTPWLGEIEVWSRVMGITRDQAEPGATLELVRADSFLMGSA